MLLEFKIQYYFSAEFVCPKNVDYGRRKMEKQKPVKSVVE
jgi:hypothetical protein